MPYRPSWYQNDERRRPSGWSGGIRSWSALRLIITVTVGVWALELVLALTGSRTLLDLLVGGLGLRAWTSSGGFNLLFPLQIFTYTLVHDPTGLGHIFWNMLFLFWFGAELEAGMGKASFLRLYLLGGAVGGLAQWALQLTTYSPVPTIGASGAVYAVMLLFACRYPRRTIILFPIPLPIPIWGFVAFRVVGDLMGAFGGAGTTAHLCHLGGAAVGVLWWRRGDVLGRANNAWRRHRNARKMEAESDDRREMDRILGKIQASGLSSLSASERAFLDRRSRQLRDQGR